MLKLNKINLVRSNKYYQNATFKGFVIDSFTAPLKTLLEADKVEFFLKDISLEIKRGERVAFLGKNGCGKTTLCRLISEQIFPTSGIFENTFHTRFFSQIENSFFRDLSGRENLAYFLNFLYPDLKKTEQKKMLADACDFSEIGKALDRRVETYSAGMINRLSLSLILLQKHDLLILDEMQSHTDLAFQKKVQQKLSTLLNDCGAVVIVTHSPEEARSLCNRGIVINDGEIYFDGAVEKACAVYKLLTAGENRA